MVGIGLKIYHFDSLLGLCTHKNEKCYPTMTKEPGQHSFYGHACGTPLPGRRTQRI